MPGISGIIALFAVLNAEYFAVKLRLMSTDQRLQKGKILLVLLIHAHLRFGNRLLIAEDIVEDRPVKNRAHACDQLKILPDLPGKLLELLFLHTERETFGVRFSVFLFAEQILYGDAAAAKQRDQLFAVIRVVVLRRFFACEQQRGQILLFRGDRYLCFQDLSYLHRIGAFPRARNVLFVKIRQKRVISA